MKHKNKIFGVLILGIINSCEFKRPIETSEKSLIQEVNIFNKYANDSIRNNIFEIAYKNESTSPSYVVFKAKNLNNGEIKEICTEAPFLSGAMHLELGVAYDLKGTEYIDNLILANQKGVFEFSSESALKNISFHDYPDRAKIEKIALSQDLDHYYETFGKNETVKFMHFEKDSGFVQESFAHVMFMCGIITSRDCVAGNNIWFGNPNIRMPEIPKLDE